MTNIQKDKLIADYVLYIDESGSSHPKDSYPYFSMGGILLYHEDKKQIDRLVFDFKQRWNIGGPLHSHEIRHRINHFEWLKSSSSASEFYEELSELIRDAPVIVVGCVVNKEGYFRRYEQQYLSDIWDMRKSVFAIVIERSVKVIDVLGGRRMAVRFEPSTSRFNNMLVEIHRGLVREGMPFDKTNSSKHRPLSRECLKARLADIQRRDKSSNLMQLADLCLYPLVRKIDNPDDKAYKILQSKLSDNVEKNRADELGVKYFCF